MSAKRSTAIKEQLAAAKLPERQVEICLRGDLNAEHTRLERDLNALMQSDNPSRGHQNKVAALARKVEAVEEQMAESTVAFTVRALKRSDWRDLVRNNPPTDDEGDKILGVDLDSLMAEAVPLSVVEPELDDEDWERLGDVLTSGEYDRLATAVWEVNRQGVDVPKSPLASRLMATHAAASKSAKPGE